MAEEKIRVLMVEPGELPRMTELQASRQAFRAAVGVGMEEEGEPKTMQIDDGIYILYNRFGGILGAGNRRVKGTTVSGVFYVLGCDCQYRPRSLTDPEMQRYLAMFQEPEYFTDSEVLDSQMKDFYEEYEE